MAVKRATTARKRPVALASLQKKVDACWAQIVALRAFKRKLENWAIRVNDCAD